MRKNSLIVKFFFNAFQYILVKAEKYKKLAANTIQ